MKDLRQRLNERYNVDIPDILAGSRNPAGWEQRRSELKEAFSREVYGRFPEYDPSKTKWEPKEEQTIYGGTKLVVYRVQVPLKSLAAPEGESGSEADSDSVSVDSFDFEFELYTPAGRDQHLPTFVFITRDDWALNHVKHGDIREYFPLNEIMERGFALAAVNVSQAASDHAESYFSDPGLRNRIGQDLEANDRIGALGLWAFNAMRVADVLNQIDACDNSRIAVIGLSRLGKSSLLAGAFDDRFSMTVSVNSGHGGSALARLKEGETTRIINQSFPHWFCPNYSAYADRENELPIDQHCLLALVAPRLLYITSSENDSWADPESEYRSAKLASTVYETIYDLPGLTADGDDRLAVETDSLCQEGTIAYHRRSGDHGLNRFDWMAVLDFAQKNGWN